MATTTVVKRGDSIVRIGRRDYSLVGWKFEAVELHVLNHQGKGTWCDIPCLARTFFGRDTQTNRKAVRRRLFRINGRMIDRRRFLVIEYATTTNGKSGEAQRVKIYEGKTEGERQAALSQLDRMRRRREVSETNYTKALSILSPKFIDAVADK